MNRRKDSNVFDMVEMKQQMKLEESDAEIQKVVQTAVERIDKHRCFVALKNYYISNGCFPRPNSYQFPHDCEVRVNSPKPRLQNRYLKYRTNAGIGVSQIVNGHWRVYITDEYFEKHE